MKINIKLVGDKEIQAKLKQLSEKSSSSLKKAITKSTIYVEGDAKKRTPVKTGRLRASITHELSERPDVYYGKVGTNTEYAPYVEFGTSRQRAQPYLYPALSESRDAILGFIEAEFKEIK